MTKLSKQESAAVLDGYCIGQEFLEFLLDEANKDQPVVAVDSSKLLQLIAVNSVLYNMFVRERLLAVRPPNSTH